MGRMCLRSRKRCRRLRCGGWRRAARRSLQNQDQPQCLTLEKSRKRTREEQPPQARHRSTPNTNAVSLSLLHPKNLIQHLPKRENHVWHVLEQASQIWLRPQPIHCYDLTAGAHEEIRSREEEEDKEGGGSDCPCKTKGSFEELIEEDGKDDAAH